MQSFRLRILCVYSLLLSIWVHSAWLVKINKNEIVIDTAEFQNFLNFQRDNEEIVVDDPDVLENILDAYIQQRILLHEAQQAGYSMKNDEIEKLYEERRDAVLMNLFIQDEIPFKEEKFIEEFNRSVKESELREFYDQYVELSGETRSFESLRDQIKEQLLLEKAQEEHQRLKDIYRGQLEKEYKVSRYDLENLIVARVEDVKITRSEIEKNLDSLLQMQYQVSPERIKQERPAEYQEFLQKVLQELILEKLVKLEMEKQGFPSTAVAQNALQILKNLIIIEYYKEKEIRAKNMATDEEISEYYEKNKDYFKGESDHEKILRFLEQKIQEEKTERYVKRLIQKKRDGSIIEKNEAELKKIR